MILDAQLDKMSLLDFYDDSMILGTHLESVP